MHNCTGPTFHRCKTHHKDVGTAWRFILLRFVCGIHTTYTQWFHRGKFVTGSWGPVCKFLHNTLKHINTLHKNQFIYVISLLEDLEPRAAEPSLRVVPIPTLREFAGAFEDVEELAEEGLFPSTESSSSKILSAKKRAHSAVSQMKQRDIPGNTPMR